MVTVVCTGGEAPPSSLSLDWLNACQRTIAADGGLGFLQRLGRKANLWIGDGDSLEGPLDRWAASFDEARLLDTEKDETDTEAAVRTAVEEGATQVWLLGGAGGRMDHWWANLRLAANEPALTRWLTSHEEAWNLGPGDQLSLPVGTVSIFPLGAGPWVLRSEGLQWPLDRVDFQSWHSLSNLVRAGGGQVSVVQGRVLVMRPFGGELV